MGTGGSAGSMQQHLIATNYPGLLDGLMTCQVFPDHMDQVMGSLDCRCPDALLLAERRAQRPRSARPTRSSPRRRAAPGLGQQPDERRQPVRPEGAEPSAPTGPSSCPLPAPLRARGRGDLVAHEPDRRALRDLRLPAVDLRRHRHAGRAERQGPLGDRQRRRPVRAEGAPGRADHAGAVRRPELQGRRHRHRRQLHAGAEGRRSGRPRDHVQQRPHERRLAAWPTCPEIDNRTGAQMDDTGFHPAMESFAYRARLDRTNGQHDTPVLWLSRTGGTVPNQFNVMRQWLDTLAADTSSDPQSREGPAREARRPPRRAASWPAA